MVYFVFNFILALIDVWLIEFYLSKNFPPLNGKYNKTIHNFSILIIFLSHLYVKQNYIISMIMILFILVILPKNYDIPKKDFFQYFSIFTILEIIIVILVNMLSNWTFDLQINIILLDWSLTYIILVESVIRYLQLLIILYITNKRTKKVITLHHFKSFSIFLSIYFGIVLITNNDKLFIFPGVGRTFVLVIIIYNIALIFFDRFQTRHEELEYEHE